MGLSFSKFTQLLGSTYKNTKPVADAAILGSMGAGSMTRTPVISGSGQASANTGFFASANTFFKSDLGKAVGSAVLSKALAPKHVEVRPAELRYATQTETNDANLEVMRQKAEAAGFNPLTVLRAGGINAYATRKTNIPSYAPALYSTKGPSYIETIAGAAAQSYFNRPTEEQKASQSLKIAQQYADLDYTRAITADARKAGSDVSLTYDEQLIALANAPKTSGVFDDYGRPVLVKPTEEIPKWVAVVDQKTGERTYIVNPELTESGPAEMATGLATLEGAFEAGRLGLMPDIESVIPPLASTKHRWPMKIKEYNEVMKPLFR